MEIAVNMFVALCVGVSYVVGYILAVLSLIFLITWLVDDKYKTHLSSALFDLCRQYWPENKEQAICKKCEDLKDMDHEVIEDNYCSLCGRELKKKKVGTADLQVEKLTRNILLFALAAAVLYTISTVLFVIFLIISVVALFFYGATTFNAPKSELSQ